MIVFVDGDIVLYRCSWASDNDPFNIALYRMEQMIDGILTETKANEFEIYLSDNNINNFRYQIDPEYKANRKDLKKPKWYEELKEHLYISWGAELALGMEADDSLGIRQTEEGGSLVCPSSCIASIDKDLLQIPGLHYNFVQKKFYEVTETDGLRQLYSQMLIGDVSDNIKGIEGLGPVKTKKLFHEITYYKLQEYEWKMFSIVKKLYNDDERLLRNGRLLYIRRKDNEIWHLPLNLEKPIEPEEEPLQLSMPIQLEESLVSTEPTLLEKTG